MLKKILGGKEKKHESCVILAAFNYDKIIGTFKYTNQVKEIKKTLRKLTEVLKSRANDRTGKQKDCFK